MVGGTKSIAYFWLLVNFYHQVPSIASSLLDSNEPSLNNIKVDHYHGCSNTTGCFGIPENCIELKNCEVFVSYEVIPSGDVAFKMEGTAESFQYLALGLSENNGLMGDDSVVFCYNAGHQIYSGMAWTFGQKTTTNLADPSYGLKNLTSTHSNGILSCFFTRSKITNIDIPGTSKSVEFDLSLPYYLQIAKGPIDTSRNSDSSFELENVKLRYHRKRGYSSTAIFFKDSHSIRSDDKTSVILAHGCLMVLSWMLFESIGSLTARYLKTHFQESWVPIPKEIYGKDWWFRVHQTCMLLTWMFTLISILIMVAGKGFRPLQLDRIKSDPHAIAGLFAVLLTFIQPFLAYFRPLPFSPRRRLFNWTHASIGYLATILSNGSIFLSTYLVVAKLVPGTRIVSALFILFLIQSHLIMTVASHKKMAFGYIFCVLGYIAYTIAFLILLFKSNF